MGLLVSAGLLGGGRATPASDEPRPSAPTAGARLYATYCANCHGERGRGDGPTASVLRVRVPDLTILSRSNNQEFPLNRVTRAIDGREPARAHGGGQMPIWGLGFQELGTDVDQERQVRERIAAVVAHLRDLQRKD